LHIRDERRVVRTYRNTAILAAVGLFLVAALTSQTMSLAVADSRADLDPSDATSMAHLDLEALRRSGDLIAQRLHAWDLVVRLTQNSDPYGRPLFESWHGEDATFVRVPERRFQRGIRGFSRVSADQDKAATGTESPSQSADTPVITYTLYNDAAYEHIRRHRLYLQSELLRLRHSGAMDDSVAGDRTVPPFPARTMVLKTAWWPVGRAGFTALPVWDPQSNPPRQGGNDYTTWRRVIAIDPHGGARRALTVPIDFAGQSFPAARRTDLRDFYHVTVSADLASRLSRDRSAQKLAVLVLGRPLAAGDSLVLVAANLATKELRDWVWTTWWWHDRAEADPFAADRPSNLVGKWRNYLLQVAFDEVTPVGADQGAHICFDPWLEGRFPDGGHGGGTVSNCLACHRRASFPDAGVLPVTRGARDLTNDPAYAPGLVRTNFLWSLALHAKP
jgi:hypothetical protein